MVEARGRSIQDADQGEIRDGGVALLRDRPSVGRWDCYASGDSTRALPGVFSDSQRAPQADPVRRLSHVEQNREPYRQAGLPSFQQLMLPTLQMLGQRREETSIGALEDGVVKSLRISVEDRARLLPSGNQTVLSNRLNWARSYLSKAGLIEMPRRGYCRATDRGRGLLAEGVGEIDVGVLERFPEFVAWRTQQKTEQYAGPAASRESPEELLASSFELLDTELVREIIERVHAFSPSFFERLIIDLLVRMGYGGGRVEMGRALGRVGDGGVDGVIKEDELGLDVV